MDLWHWLRLKMGFKATIRTNPPEDAASPSVEDFYEGDDELADPFGTTIMKKWYIRVKDEPKQGPFNFEQLKQYCASLKKLDGLRIRSDSDKDWCALDRLAMTYPELDQAGLVALLRIRSLRPKPGDAFTITDRAECEAQNERIARLETAGASILEWTKVADAPERCRIIGKIICGGCSQDVPLNLDVSITTDSFGTDVRCAHCSSLLNVSTHIRGTKKRPKIFLVAQHQTRTRNGLAPIIYVQKAEAI